LLADEPTGALDRLTAEQVLALMNELRERYGLTVLMVTHDMEISRYADRVLTLRDGSLGQDLSHVEDLSLQLDEIGQIKLPQMAQAQLHNAERIAVEIRPEGVLLRPQSPEQVGEWIQQEKAPEKPKRFGWLRRKR
jgi:putative ABC transport system ATP-binding protein